MTRTAPLPRDHNGGPPLDDPHTPEWGSAPIRVYFHWKAARQVAFRPPSQAIAKFRVARAEAVGLTYEEYTSELLDSGRYLQPGDTARIAAIKARRRS